MAKIIAIGEYMDRRSQVEFETKLRSEIEKVEKELDIPEDEGLMVLTDTNVLTIGNYLFDIRDTIDKILDILDIGIIGEL